MKISSSLRPWLSLGVLLLLIGLGLLFFSRGSSSVTSPAASHADLSSRQTAAPATSASPSAPATSPTGPASASAAPALTSPAAAALPLPQISREMTAEDFTQWSRPASSKGDVFLQGVVQSAPDGRPLSRTAVVRSSTFKYPLVRIEQILTPGKAPEWREMVADHLLLRL